MLLARGGRRRPELTDREPARLQVLNRTSSRRDLPVPPHQDQSMPGAGGSLSERQARFSGGGDTILVTGVVKHLASRDGGTTWVTTDSASEPPKRFCRAGNTPRFADCE